MKIKQIQRISFKRALREFEIAGYTKTLKEARDVLGANGKNVLIIPDTSLPTSDKSIIGNLSDEKALEFVDLMKTYLGINAIEHLPQGDYHENSHHFNPYNSTSLTHAKHLINLENFTKEEFGTLLKPEEIKENKHTEESGKSRVHFEDIYNKDSDFNDALKLAYSRFDEKNPLWKDYLEYRKENDANIIPRVLFSKLADKYWNYDFTCWPEPDATLFQNVDEKKQERLEELKKEHKDEIDFYAFQQFYANKNLKHSKEKLNQKGIDLIGDCPIRFSRDEIWANPDACKGDLTVGQGGWNIEALDYKNLFDEKGEPLPSMQLLGKKFSKMLKDYDGIRVDCGWCYVQPSLYDKTGKRAYVNNEKNFLDDKIVKYFDKLAKEIKGKDYDLSKIMYETEVGPYEDFFGFDPKGGVIEPLKGRVQIFTTTFASEKWGTLKNYKLRGIKNDELLIGTGNHDSAPINNLYKKETPLSEEEIESLNKMYTDYFKYRVEFKTKEDLIKAKRAEIATAKNQMHFFYDIFGWKLNKGEEHNLVDNYYSTKISKNFKEEYINSLKVGTGYNPMESIQLAFLRSGKDEEHKELYDKVSRYSAILKAEEGELLEPIEGGNQGKGKNNKKTFAIIGGILAGLAGLGALVFSKPKEKPKKKEKV